MTHNWRNDKITEKQMNYIIEMNDIRYAQIHFELGDNWYLLSGEEKQELIEIIKNLKELE